MPDNTWENLPDWERVLSAARLQQILPNPLPYDLEETNLAEYKNLDPQWQDWNRVKTFCARCATILFDRIGDQES